MGMWNVNFHLFSISSIWQHVPHIVGICLRINYTSGFWHPFKVLFHFYPICSVCNNYNLVLSTFTTCYRISINCNTTGVTARTGIVYPSGAPGFIPFLSRVPVAQSIVYWVVFCKPLLVFSRLYFVHCIVCVFPYYGFWLHIWYLEK